MEDPSSAQEAHYEQLIEALPGSYLLFRADPPLYSVVAASPKHFEHAGTTKEFLIGKSIFDAYPANPDDPSDTGPAMLRASLDRVLDLKAPDRLPVQRYDVQNESGEFVERHWRVESRPVFSTSGDIRYILHCSEDITDQIKAIHLEEKIRGLEVLNSIFNQMPVPFMLLTGPTHVIEVVNTPMKTLLAADSEISGQPLLEALPGLVQQSFLGMIKSVLDTAQPRHLFESDLKLVKTDTSPAEYYNYFVHPFRDMNNRTITGVIVMAFDVTERVLLKRQVELKTAVARELHEKLSSYLDAVPQIVWTNKPNGETDFYNQQWFRFTGLTFEQSKEWGWKQIVHPEDFEHTMTTYQNELKNGIELTIENRLRRFDGSYRWHLNRSIPIKDTIGNIRFWIGTSTDIHDRKIAEQRLKESEKSFRQLADDSPMFVFILDIATTPVVSYWNKTWLEYTGQPEDQSLGNAWNECVHPDDIAIAVEHYSKGFDNHGSYVIPAVRIRRHDGVYRWHSFKGNPRYHNDGTFNGYIGVGFDIHEQKISEERLEELVHLRTIELERTNENLVRSNRSLEEFAHAASHDLKEPVRKIRYYSEQLKDELAGKLSPSQEQSFSRIEKATDRMTNLINDLLSYSEANQTPDNLEDVDLNEKLARVMDDLDLEIANKKAVIRSGKLPMFRGNRRQLQQVFQNLLSNALKYSADNMPPEITITATRVIENGKPYHQIAFRDNGIGFEQEYAERVFKMFIRLHKKTQYSGTGVGLSIVRRVLENHHGFIRVESSPGQGSTFFVYLPVTEGLQRGDNRSPTE